MDEKLHIDVKGIGVWFHVIWLQRRCVMAQPFQTHIAKSIEDLTFMQENLQNSHMTKEAMHLGWEAGIRGTNWL